MTDAGPHLNRRAALLAFAAVAAAPLGLSRAMAAPSRGAHVVYRLDPVHRPGAGKSTSNCTGCTACRHHARNKLFATSKAADRVRAHKGCKCKVVRAAPVSADTYEALFGSPRNLKQALGRSPRPGGPGDPPEGLHGARDAHGTPARGRKGGRRRQEEVLMKRVLDPPDGRRAGRERRRRRRRHGREPQGQGPGDPDLLPLARHRVPARQRARRGRHPRPPRRRGRPRARVRRAAGDGRPRPGDLDRRRPLPLQRRDPRGHGRRGVRRSGDAPTG